MSKQFIPHLLASLMVAGLLAACAQTTPHLDQNFGAAVNQAKALQIANPDASSNTNPVAGIDGEAASGAMDRYQKSFQTPPRPLVFTLGTGTVGGGGGSSGGTSR